MLQKGLTILLVAFLLISLCFVAVQAGFSEKFEEIHQQLEKNRESIAELIQNLKITVLENEMKDLQQDVKVLTNEVKKGNQLQIYFALFSLSPIPPLFWFGYKKIVEFWREGDVSGRAAAILCSSVFIYIMGLLLFLADIYLF